MGIVIGVLVFFLSPILFMIVNGIIGESRRAYKRNELYKDVSWIMSENLLKIVLRVQNNGVPGTQIKPIAEDLRIQPDEIDYVNKIINCFKEDINYQFYQNLEFSHIWKLNEHERKLREEKLFFYLFSCFLDNNESYFFCQESMVLERIEKKPADIYDTIKLTDFAVVTYKLQLIVGIYGNYLIMNAKKKQNIDKELDYFSHNVEDIIRNRSYTVFNFRP